MNNQGLSADAVEKLRNDLWDRMEATEMGEACAFREAIDLLEAAAAEAQPVAIALCYCLDCCELRHYTHDVKRNLPGHPE